MADSFKKKEEQEEAMSFILRSQEEKRAQSLAAKLNLPYINLLRVPIEIDALSKVPEDKARQGLFLPFEITGTRIAVATFNPKDKTLKQYLEKLDAAGYDVEIFVCSMSSLKRGFEEYKKIERLQKRVVKEIDISSEQIEEIEKSLNRFQELSEKLKASKKNTTSFLETLFASALKFNASDIHIIPEEESARIRYRIDGVLHDIFSVDRNSFNSILSRIKLISELKINIHDVAQDGRFTINLKGKETEIRVSIVPGENGEDIVMRILNPEMLLSIEDLGFHPWYEKMILHQMKKTIGMILTCGPTGSGKTTTLYACLRHIAKPETKVLTIEDPIEYHLENVDQTQVEHEKGYDFAKALRAALRQDPDVILVGEIRDAETAFTAVQASQTGHLVFSTLHTNDAAGIIPRLIEMGVDSSSVASALNLAISQRLIRRACKKCSKKISPPDELLSKIKKNLEKIPKDVLPPEVLSEKGEVNLEKIKIVKAKGCQDCYNTGYRGRLGVYEMFKMTPRIEEMIVSSPSIFDMRRVIVEEGMITMQQDGLLRVIEGTTTLEELERVTGPLE